MKNIEYCYSGSESGKGAVERHKCLRREEKLVHKQKMGLWEEQQIYEFKVNGVSVLQGSFNKL